MPSQTLPTASDVIALTGTELPEPVVTAVISDAVIAGGECIAALIDPAYTSAVKWLAAHMIASTNDGATMTSRKLGDAQESYARAVTGSGIMGTTYGQQAIAIAPCLSGLGMRQVKFKVL